MINKKKYKKLKEKVGKDLDILGLKPDPTILDILQKRITLYKKTHTNKPQAITVSQDQYKELINLVGNGNPVYFKGVPIYDQSKTLNNSICNNCELIYKYGLDLELFGAYKWGLIDEEIKTYLKERARSKRLGKLYIQFSNIAGVNTCAMGPQGQTLMYRHDVKRFADKLFDGKATYWD